MMTKRHTVANLKNAPVYTKRKEKADRDFSFFFCLLSNRVRRVLVCYLLLLLLLYRLFGCALMLSSGWGIVIVLSGWVRVRPGARQIELSHTSLGPGHPSSATSSAWGGWCTR